MTKPRRISGTDIAWPTRVPNRICQLSWGISDRVGTSGMSESLLESAFTGGTILLEVRWTADAQLSHSVNQRCPLHSQSLRSAIRSAHDPIVRFQRSDYMISLNFRKTRHGNVGGGACGERFQLGGGGAQYGMRRENDGSFDKVLQFANVSGPAVSHQGIHCVRRDLIDSFVHSSSVELGEMTNQLRNVLRTLPQCGNADWKYL
jgi:hypothetical protein